MRSTKIKIFTIALLAMCFIQACTSDEPNVTKVPTSLFEKTNNDTAVNTMQYNNTKGFYANGKIISEFDCPDAISTFPPIDLLFWERTPAVNGRLPSFGETQNGTAIAHYGEKSTSKVKPYNLITLPKLAYLLNSTTKANEYLVVVIQITQTEKDTVVGFRYLAGGCGGSTFSNFHFLTDAEVKQTVNKVNTKN